MFANVPEDNQTLRYHGTFFIVHWKISWFIWNLSFFLHSLNLCWKMESDCDVWKNTTFKGYETATCFVLIEIAQSMKTFYQKECVANI